MKFILGKKVEMTQKFTEHGVAPVTVVSAGPCTVTQVKNSDSDGYQAIQLGYELRNKKNSKSVQGHLKDLPNFRYIKEFRSENTPKRGQVATVAVFEPGEKVSVTGVSKGKGFQGVVKRWSFAGSLATHGHKDQVRMGGSIGSTGPQRVFKGVKMPGRMGNDQVTVKNLEIIEVDSENNLLYIKGAVPGSRNGLIMITAEGDMSFVDAGAKKEEKPEETAKTQPSEASEKKEEKQPEEAPKAEDQKAEAVSEENKEADPKSTAEEKKEEPKEEKKES